MSIDTTRARLHELVDQLDDEHAAQLLAAAASMVPGPRDGRDLPAFVGLFHSGRTDISERSEEILRAELGGQTPS